MKLEDLTDDEKQLLLCGIATVGKLMEKLEMPYEVACSTIHEILGHPEPTERTLDLANCLFDAANSEVSVIRLEVATPPEEYNQEERCEHVLSEIVAGVRKLAEEITGDGEGCTCKSCSSRRKVLGEVDSWATTGEPLVNHQSELLEIFLKIGIPKEAITSMYRKAGVADPFGAQGGPTPSSTGERILH